jgi:endonuclease/exonuclease/phosphatase family metal-dependent hydrolase
MRVINWNCCRGRHDVKLPPLLRLKPDLAIVQETPRPATSLAPSQLWHGTNLNQGLLALAFGAWRLEQAGEFLAEPQFFLPAKVIGPKEQFNLLAVWVKPGTRSPLYVSSLLDGLDVYSSFMSTGPTLVVGDLNVYWQGEEEPYRRYSLISAYHSYFASPIRSERHPTYYFYWRRSRPYHVDYCLLPRAWRRRIRRVQVGSYQSWTGRRLSDHCPVIVDLSERRSVRPRLTFAT